MHPLVAQWVSRFRLAGPDALRSHKKGRKPTMEKQTREKKEKKDKRPMGQIQYIRVQIG